MPSIRTITTPRLSPTLNLSNCDIKEDIDGILKAYTNLEFDLSELSEGMELNLNEINIPTDPIIDSLPYISKVTYNESKNTFTYHSSTAKVYAYTDSVLINLPTGVYLPDTLDYDASYDYHTLADDIVQFLMQSSVFNFSLMSDTYEELPQDYQPDENSTKIPAIDIVHGISDTLYDSIEASGSDGLSLVDYTDGNDAGLYYHLPYLAYISQLTGNKTLEVSNGVAEGYKHLKVTGIVHDADNYIPRLRKQDLQKALPFIGKTITIFNFPGSKKNIAIKGIRPDILTSVQTEADSANSLLTLCKYVNGQSSLYGNEHSFIQLKCNSYPLVGGYEKKSGFYIGWDIVSASVDPPRNQVLNKASLPTFKEDKLTSVFSK